MIKSSQLGGGGGKLLNTFEAFSSGDILHITEDEQEWLKTGNLETDLESYPDASIDAKLGYNKYFTTELVNPSGTVPGVQRSIVYSNAHDMLFISGDGNATTLYAHSLAGTYDAASNITLQATGGEILAVGMTDDEIYTVESDTTRKLRVYDLTGTFLREYSVGMSYHCTGSLYIYDNVLYIAAYGGNYTYLYSRDLTDLDSYDVLVAKSYSTGTGAVSQSIGTLGQGSAVFMSYQYDDTADSRVRGFMLDLGNFLSGSNGTATSAVISEDPTLAVCHTYNHNTGVYYIMTTQSVWTSNLFATVGVGRADVQYTNHSSDWNTPNTGELTPLYVRIK